MRTRALCIVASILSVATAGRTAAAQDRGLTVHGHLTQAYARSEGGTFLGVSERGTTDYRNAALQFRFGLSTRDNVTVQVSHRRLGEDLAGQGEAEVRLDWAFYARSFGGLTVRLGRTPIPAGIYNEIRDVGVLLPLYRAPFGFYLEGSFTSETVDGVVANWLFGDPSGWSVDVAGFAGGWTMTERAVQDSVTVLTQQSRVERGAGGQVWLSAPVQGVRVGGGLSRYENPESAILPGIWNERHASLDASLDRATIRSEIRRISSRDFTYDTWYAYAGIRPLPQLTLHGQVERSDLTFGSLPRFDFHDEQVIGASWMFRPNFILKLEGHRGNGYWAESPARQIGVDAPGRVDTAILSISTSF